jgi:hypothetical protein
VGKACVVNGDIPGLYAWYEVASKRYIVVCDTN